MPYNCTITDDNKFMYEHRIYELITAFNSTYNIEVLNCIIVAIVEYLFAMTFINTSQLVSMKAAFKKLNLSSDEMTLIVIMKQVRDAVVHAPDQLTLALMHAFRASITPNAIKWLLIYFNNKEVIVNLFKWMKQNYAVYNNITAYCNKLNLSDKEFDKDKIRLMKLLEANTYSDLDDKIVALL